ncbi:MAG: hypothetical protein Q7S40_30445 [Opitutaceae bacterium]|nr:hypothetical protein [Opitutaceae bacterium]
MTRSPLVSLLVVAAVFGVGSALAEDAPPVLKQNSTPSTSGPAVQKARRSRAVSPEVTAQLTAASPKFDPAASAKPTELGPDLREIDRPRNTIIRLPDYVVQEEKPVVLKERQVETPRSRLELALKKNPGLRLGSFWIFRNDGIALAMHEEEERLVRMKETNELLTLLPAAEQKQLKPLVDQSFMRQ